MKTLIRILLWVGGILGLVSLVLYFTILEPWTVPTDDPQLAASIAPSLLAGDSLLLSRRSTSEPGALVRCADPDAAGRFVIGRILGGAGAAVDIENGVVRINNRSPSAPTACGRATVRNPATQEDLDLKCSDEEYGGIYHQVLQGPTAEKDTHVAVDLGHVFLVSDDRVIHLDSRDFGQISAVTCQRILYRPWSTDESKRMSLVW